MEWGQARTVLRSVFSREDDVALSRRDMLAGLGLAGLLLAAPKLLSSGVAEAKTLGPAVPQAGSAHTDPKVTEQSDLEARDVEPKAAGDVTEFSAHRRRWRRRYWHHRHWRRRHWRRRYWRRRYRRYW